jgi:hypothetical protein
MRNINYHFLNQRIWAALGDIVTKAKSVINISGYQFVSGQQIRINFELLVFIST